MTQQLTVIEGQAVAVKPELSVDDVVSQVQRIQAVMKTVMQEGEHYGAIPGTGSRKPSLLKAGAEKLLLTFRLDPQYEVISSTETDDLIAYMVRCTLYHIPTGERIAAAVASCNSREKSNWKGNPWGYQNTILKMASKRAMVGAVLNGTAASDIFTQDLEDMPREQPQRPAPMQRQQQRPAPRQEPIEAVVAEVIESFPEAETDADADGDTLPPHARATYVETNDGVPYFDLDGLLFSVEETKKGPVWVLADPMLCAEHSDPATDRVSRFYAKPLEPDSKHAVVWLCKGNGAAHAYQPDEADR